MNDDSRATLIDVDNPQHNELWDDLVRAGADGHLVVLVGAGASRDADLPGWEGLVEQLFARAKEQSVGRGDVLHKLSAVENLDLLEKPSALAVLMGEAWLRDAIVGLIEQAAVEPTKLHHALVALPNARLVTTNYDTLLEQAARAAQRPLRAVTPLDTDEIARDEPMVLKLHGSVDRPQTIVIAVEDYYRLEQEEKQAWRERLKAYFQPPFRLLMVGYSYRDLNIRRVLDELRSAYGDHLRPPIWLASGTREEREKDELRARIHHLDYLPVEDHEAVVALLERLGESIRQRKRVGPADVVVPLSLASDQLDDLAVQARMLVDAGDFAAAERAVQTALERADCLARENPDNEQMCTELARARLNRAAMHLMLRQEAEGRALLEQVEAERLACRPATLANLVTAWAELDEVARARDALRWASGELSAGDRLLLEQATQLVEIVSGVIPENPLSPLLHLRVARVAMMGDRLGAAVRWIDEALAANPVEGWHAADALPMLVYCLERSVRENPPAQQPVPREGRARALTLVERALTTLDRCHLPAGTTQELVRWRERFFGLTHDFERSTGSGALQAEEMDFRVDRALARARAGDVDAALEMLRDEAHPWLPALRQAGVLGAVGRREEAESLLQRTAERYPGKYDLHLVLAESLIERSKPAAALPHARVAFNALPGRGARIALVRALAESARDADRDRDLLAEAWNLLEPLADSSWLLALRLRATVATYTGRVEAVELWDRFLATQSDDGDAAALLQMARAMWRAGRADEAAQAAWRAFERGREQLTPHGLGTCARLQLLGTQLSETAVARTKEIDRVLCARFPGDAEAEQLHAHISTALGFPPDLDPVDYEGLAASGAARAISVEQLGELLGSQQQRAQAFEQLYCAGLITIETLCRETRTWPAQLLAAVHDAARAYDAVFLATPVGPALNAVPELSERELLTGEIELLILQHLGLLDALRRALHPRGAVLLFEDVWSAIEEATSSLALSGSLSELRRERQMLGTLEAARNVVMEPADAVETAEQLTRRHDATLVADAEPGDGTACVSPYSLIELMQRRGLLAREPAARVLTALGEPTPSLDGFPPRLVVDWALLETVQQLGALQELVQAVDSLFVPSEVHRRLRQRLHELERAEASERASKELHRWLAEGRRHGWVQVIARSTVPDLPPVAEKAHAVLGRLLHDSMQVAISWREALVGHPRRLLVTADFLVAALFTGAAPLSVLRQVGWTPEGYQRIAERIRRVLPQQLELPELAFRLGTPLQAPKIAEALAELGFQQALPAERIVELERTYGGLDGARVKRLLDRTEWVARLAEHPGHTLARLNLTRAYAQAIWRLWQDESLALTRATGASQALLARTADLDARGRADALEQLVGLLAANVADAPRSSFVTSEDAGADGGQTLVFSFQTRGDEMWRFIDHWAGDNRLARAAIERAVLEVLCSCDQRWEEAIEAGNQAAKPLAALAVAKWACTLATPQQTLRPSAAAVLTLSSRWGELRPLDEMPFMLDSSAGKIETSFGRVLDQALALLSSRRAGLVARSGAWEVPMLTDAGTSDNKVPVPFPPEALLLRAPSELVPVIASPMAHDISVHDGQMVALLAALAAGPPDEAAPDELWRGKFARAASAAPWRLLRDDPSWLLSWGNSDLGQLGPRTLDELRLLLAEPEALGDRDAIDVLRSRLEDDGAWHARSDVHRLARMASEIPGDLPGAPLDWRFDPEDYTDEVETAIWRLEHPREQPLARLMGEIMFLRSAAAAKPLVELERGTCDLHEVLPPLLAEVLELELRASKAPPDRDPTGTSGANESLVKSDEGQGLAARLTIGAMEPILLGHCFQVVRRLEARTHTLHPQERTWLSWRLWQWVEAQLDLLEPDQRASAMALMREAASLDEPRVDLDAVDVLDPRRLARGGNAYRVAGVLYALHYMEAAARAVTVAHEQQAPSPRSVSSARLEQTLLTLAARPLTDVDIQAMQRQNRVRSRLGWNGAWTVPELALCALLRLNRATFLDLPAAAQSAWLGLLPKVTGDQRRLSRATTLGLLSMIASHARSLGEIRALRLVEAVTTAINDDAEMRPAGALALIGLMRAGVTEVEPEVQRLIEQAVGNELWYGLVEHFLLATAEVAPDRLEPEVRSLAARAANAEVGPIPVIVALARVTFATKPEHVAQVRDVLVRLVQEEPYCQDQRVREIVGALGLETGST